MRRQLTFTTAEKQTLWHTHRVMDLCDYLSGTVLEPMFAREGMRWQRRFMDFVTFDTCTDPMAPTGTIRFAVPLWFTGRVGELETAITQQLSKLQIRTAPFAYERDPQIDTIEAILITITDNPTALLAPPAVDMSRTQGCIVLRDLLGYQWANGRYEFTADDLVKRASSVTEDKIAACTASPVKGPEGLRRTPSPIGMKAARRCLEEIKHYGQWALSHNHRQLAAV